MAGVPFVGLTGGLGAGKSEALRALGELGAATLSTDEVVHELLRATSCATPSSSGSDAEVAPDGRVDRALVAERVFGDDEARAWLEGELWPRVGERVAEWKQEVEALDPAPPAAVVEVPLLFESGMEPPSTPPSPWWRTRPCASSAPARAGTRRWRGATGGSSPRRRSRSERTTWCATTARSRS